MSSTMVQIRDVPEEFHRRLKARAATEGMSMSAYILRELEKALEKPTRTDVLQRIRKRSKPGLSIDSVRVIAAGRAER